MFSVLADNYWAPGCTKITLLIEFFQVHQQKSRRFPVFPGGISNSRRFPVFPVFPGVVDTLCVH